jgi:malonyl-CoA O-methyltransferase
MTLHCQRLTAAGGNGTTAELVLIHGWGMSSQVWQSWLPLLRRDFNISLIDLPGYGLSPAGDYSSVDALLRSIMEVAPAKAVYLGYSLGGMLVLNIAGQFPQRVSAVVTLASNVQFVASQGWPDAMAEKTFDSFYGLVEKNSPLALKRFAGLQLHGVSNDGTRNEKTLLKNLRDKAEVLDKTVLTDSLRMLASIDNHELIHRLSIPALHLFGGNDSLVPVAAAEKLQKYLSTSIAIIWSAPHAVFLSEPQLSWQRFERFLQDNNLIPAPPRNLDKKQVARSFSRAATTYDSVAELQRRVGERLLEFMPQTSAGVVIDLGCGTGYFNSPLQQIFPSAKIIGLDLAEGMVAYARQHQGVKHCLCADAEVLPLANNSVDVIFSSLAVQWCEDTQALYSEIFRVLKPGGYFVYSTLGPETLHELRQAWSEVDDYVHVNRFTRQSSLRAAIENAGFDAEDFIEENINLEFDSLRNLTRELKSLGAHNVNSGRPAGLTGRQRMLDLINAYERHRNARGLLPASYQTWYQQLQKPLLNSASGQQLTRQAYGKA